MKRFHTAAHRIGMVGSFVRTASTFALCLALAASLWFVSAPVVTGAAGTPAEMIQANLPPATTLATASQVDVLNAVCKAVGRNPKDAPQIARTAAGARKTLSGDIVATTVRCLKGDPKDSIDCALVRSALREVIAVDAENAAAHTEAVMALAPGCIDIPEEGPTSLNGVLNNINFTPGNDTTTDTCTVCHNNQSIQIACNDRDEYLANHPGDTPGACQATPEANR